MQEAKQSILTLESQKKLTLSGVESVDAFSETAILLTVCGKRVRVAGSKMKIVAFSQGSGNFSAVGDFTAVRYGAERGGFFRKLFR